MQLQYGSQNLVLEKNRIRFTDKKYGRIRFTDKKYECIRNYDKNIGGGGGRGEGGGHKFCIVESNAFSHFYHKI